MRAVIVVGILKDELELLEQHEDGHFHGEAAGAHSEDIMLLRRGKENEQNGKGKKARIVREVGYFSQDQLRSH